MSAHFSIVIAGHFEKELIFLLCTKLITLFLRCFFISLKIAKIHYLMIKYKILKTVPDCFKVNFQVNWDKNLTFPEFTNLHNFVARIVILWYP